MIIIRYLRCREGTLRCREKGWPLNTGKLRGVDCIRSQGRLCVRERVRGGTRRNAGDDLFICMCLMDNRPLFFAFVYMSDFMSHIWMRHVTLMNEREETRAIVYSIVYSHINELFNCLFRLIVYYVYIHAHTSEETYIYEKRPIKIYSWLLSIHV